MVCGRKLEYLAVGREFTCLECGKKEIGYVHCPGGYYICDDCHGEGVFSTVAGLILSSEGTNPLLMAEDVLKRTSLPMPGCEHAWIAAGALLAAVKNEGTFDLNEEQIREALTRTKKQAVGAYCGLTGVCGIAPAVGASFSVILGAACPKDKETSTTMHAVSRVIEAIANETGPCCCKNFLRTALYLGIHLPHAVEIICRDSDRRPHGCRETNKSGKTRVTDKPSSLQESMNAGLLRAGVPS